MSANFTHYPYPYGPVTGYDVNATKCNKGHWDAKNERLWRCWRPVGHEGRHESGGLRGKAIYATWEDDAS